MKTNLLLIILVVISYISCDKKAEISSISPENWSKRMATINDKDSLEYGKSYLSIYSQIYSISQLKKHNLTAMIGLRNISDTDTIYVLRAEYFDTNGHSVRNYFEHPIFLAPMETAEIVIEENDISGGTGSNFLFEWKIPDNCPEPLFEGIMSSTMGQQGLSFTTQGIRIK